MWAVMAIGYVLAAIGINAVIVRITKLPPLVSFLASGTMLGIVLIAHALLMFDAAVVIVAAVLLYVAGCELFLIVMTTLISSIAVRTIRFIGEGPIAVAALTGRCSEGDIIGRRLERIKAIGLATNDHAAWQLTRKGRLLLGCLARLRVFFRHAGDR